MRGFYRIPGCTQVHSVMRTRTRGQDGIRLRLSCTGNPENGTWALTWGWTPHRARPALGGSPRTPPPRHTHTQSTSGLRVAPLTSQDPRDACPFALPCPRTELSGETALGVRNLFTHPPSSCLSNGLRVWGSFFSSRVCLTETEGRKSRTACRAQVPLSGTP